jgi:zinc transporter 9
MSTELLLIIFITFIAGFVPGCLSLWLGHLLKETPLRWLTGLAAGLLLTAALVIAVPEGFEIVSNNMEMLSESAAGLDHEEHYIEGVDVVSLQVFDVMKWAGPGVVVLAGFLVMMLIESLGISHSIHEEHHNHEGEYGHMHLHHPRGLSSIVAIGLTVHAVTDGVAIGAGMATGALDVAVPQLVGVVFHKIPAAFSLGVFALHELRQSRAVLRSIIFYILLFSIATPVSVYWSWYCLGNINELWTGIALLFSAGTFLYVATVDFLPNMHDPSTGRSVLLQVVLATILMLTTVFVLNLYY